MRLSIVHTTNYNYDSSVRPMPHLAYLRPRSDAHVELSSFALKTTPAAKLTWLNDDLNNVCAHLEFTEASSSLEVATESVVKTRDGSPFEFSVRDYAVDLPFSYERLHADNLAPGCAAPPPDVRLSVADFLNQAFSAPPTNTVQWLFQLAAHFPKYFRYTHRAEEGIYPTGKTFADRSGSCRDLATAFMDCARFVGIAARFVSGYHFDHQAHGQNGEMHAWVEVYLPGAGWIGIDPTHGVFCDGAYVPVAHAFVAESVNPLQGSLMGPRGLRSQLSTRLRIERAAS